MIVCPLCGSDSSRVIYDCRDVPPRINTLAGMIHQCTDCQFLYKESTQQSLNALEEIYQYTIKETEFYFGPVLKGYDENSAEIRLYSYVLEEIHRRIGPATNSEQRLLDVGCATGAMLDQSRAFGFTPYGVELNPNFARYAREEFGIPVIAGELNVEHFESESFAAITMIDLIEHVPDPLGLLNTARQLLRPDGLLVVYTPNHRSLIVQLSLALYHLTGGRIRTPADTVFGTNHVCFFDHVTLPVALRRTGYTVDAVHRIKYDPGHQGEVSDQSGMAIGLKALETFSQLIGLPYRLLAFAHKPAKIDEG